MCKNCGNPTSRWYFSSKQYMDYLECVNCQQILETQKHMHIFSNNWTYDRVNNRDILRCKVCTMILKKRPHVIGFQDESDVFENWLTSAEPQEDYTRKRKLQM